MRIHSFRNAVLRRGLFSYLGVAYLAISGCWTEESEPRPSAESVISTTQPVYAMDVGGGQTVEFYDLDGFSLVSESGPANVPRLALDSIDAAMAPSRPADLFRVLRPNATVPKVLVDLQEKSERRLAAAGPRPVSAVTRGITGAGFQGNATSKTNEDIASTSSQLQEGCNNGCCDREWLKTVGCGWTGYDWSWWQFNYGWSYVNASGLWYYRDNVCSASGTSRWTFSVCLNGCVTVTWDVPQGTYRYEWGVEDNIFFSYSISSYVNSSNAQHLHNHCGVEND
jgi:hypothetical protein